MKNLLDKIIARKAQTMYTIEWVDKHDDHMRATEDFAKAYAVYSEVVATAEPYNFASHEFDVVVRLRSINAYEWDHMTTDSQLKTLFQTTISK